jgi:hypothetical protein
MPTFNDLWIKHPYPNNPCDTTAFPNQCAIRMTVALHDAGINTALLRCVRCWHGHKNPSHILRAQEFANALALAPQLLGPTVKIAKFKGSINSNLAEFTNNKGVVFIRNGWGATDHIDLWDGVRKLMRGSSDTADYMARGDQVWFWKMI